MLLIKVQNIFKNNYLKYKKNKLKVII